QNTESPDRYFYFSSLSSRTIVYKGMLTPAQLMAFYLDLQDIDMKSSLALVHSRFSTNTFPSWERAHPNRCLIHNGEINTITANVHWTRARQGIIRPASLGNDFSKILPVINEDGSDSAMLDNYIQFLVMAGIPLPEAMTMVIPEPWEYDETMDEKRRAFYAYNSCLMEAWDGPAAIGFSDGRFAGALLDRNGLRPARYTITRDNTLVLSSETGVLAIPPEKIQYTGMLKPGEILLVDTEQKRLINNEEFKKKLSEKHPYEKWMKENLKEIDDLISGTEIPERTFSGNLRTLQRIFGYSYEDTELILRPLCETGEEAISSMGTDIPLAILSERPQLLYNYFKQLFAQVTNPPIDALREKIVTSSYTLLGGGKDILVPGAEHCRRIRLKTPILSRKAMAAIQKQDDFKIERIPIFLKPDGEDSLPSNSLEEALGEICGRADSAIEQGHSLLILSDEDASEQCIPIPALLACSALHHHLIRKGSRMKASIIICSGEPREVHHFAALLGFGANAVHPYLAIGTALSLPLSFPEGKTVSAEEREHNYIHAVTGGIIKIMSKMGISTIQSYMGAQVFEALGIDKSVTDIYFPGTVSRIGGLTIDDIERECLIRHREAFRKDAALPLESAGEYSYRAGGEHHLYRPETILMLQEACRSGNYELYKQFVRLIDGENEKVCTIRGLLGIRELEKPLALDRIEPVESILRRFKTGAMSYGSISKEAHECMAVAMNRLGGKSNSGEGGEIAERFSPGPDGLNRNSAIKQVASGRFGVSIEYLRSANEIQIKMAQGAKPGEGGHLPGKKVYPWIGEARNSSPGVELISPPPHHDIYSIEDLAQLIHDLSHANPEARISVKLVSKAGVGTVAVGVAKGKADVILISGYDGGTGAAPRTSIRHTGLPWELGLAEAHQALLLNKLRNRVRLEVDGKLLTGRDVVIAALLGAEEFGFATAPLVAMGCVMMRACHHDTCPAGIATQNPELRKRFKGKPEYVENFMRFIARDLREWMARIGVHSINELVGHAERLYPERTGIHWKTRTVDLTALLYQPWSAGEESKRYFHIPQDHGVGKSMDMSTLINVCRPAIEQKRRISYKLEINNTHRTVGAVISGLIAERHGAKGLAEDTINLDFIGEAGQSFGAFAISGMTIHLHGAANDYLCKGLSGGKVIVSPDERSVFEASENIIAGNVALYGAIRGELYLNGRAGERFCVRNSGALAVAEGIGNHGCEYMTGGTVLILGTVGRNFGAGMSGGTAYIYDPEKRFSQASINPGLILETAGNDEELRRIIENHIRYTGSKKAGKILDNWKKESMNFIRIIPGNYRRIISLIAEMEAQGKGREEARRAAFDLFIQEGAVSHG
ncbi:glutamate synthase large subunit, partial [Treponema sp. OttesenSCG-928-L16]|nr:glutamate synthase large subunit [Treponema sp. OttesenSCG-928-L16]